MNWSLSEKLILAEVFFNDYFSPMILANCRCHTALSAFSMPNEASLDHNWHSWKIHRQTCFPIIFNCQTFCTNKCCSTFWSRRARAGCAAFPSWLHLKRLEHGAGSSPSCCLSVVDLKSPSAPTAGFIVTLPSSLWFGPGRKAAAASHVAEWLRVAYVHRSWWTRSVCSKPTQMHLTGISVQLQKHRQRQTQIY